MGCKIRQYNDNVEMAHIYYVQITHIENLYHRQTIFLFKSNEIVHSTRKYQNLLRRIIAHHTHSLERASAKISPQ